MVEKSTGKTLNFRTENGSEYTSKKFEEFIKSEGIRHKYTIPKTAEQKESLRDSIKHWSS